MFPCQRIESNIITLTFYECLIEETLKYFFVSRYVHNWYLNYLGKKKISLVEICSSVQQNLTYVIMTTYMPWGSPVNEQQTWATVITVLKWQSSYLFFFCERFNLEKRLRVCFRLVYQLSCSPQLRLLQNFRHCILANKSWPSIPLIIEEIHLRRHSPGIPVLLAMS